MKLIPGAIAFSIVMTANAAGGVSEVIEREQNISAQTPPVGTLEWRDAIRLDGYDSRRSVLQQELMGASTIPRLLATLAEAGYAITAVNERSADYHEYEVVKGDDSFELHVELKDASTIRGIDVTSNLWPAEETARATGSPDYQARDLIEIENAGPLWSDQEKMLLWSEERERLGELMPAGKAVQTYLETLEGQGYRVTAVNDVEADQIELEVVKQGESFEVHMDKDPQSSVVREVSVVPNIWHADATERAMAEGK